MTDRGRHLVNAALQDHLEAETTLIEGIAPASSGPCIDLLWALVDRIPDWVVEQSEATSDS
ncbi:MAG: hypothetical protein GEU79_11460 [Acidimicrobiia bacterium]|nr:hypothetical protein [Acidimicrobiia bacterium]